MDRDLTEAQRRIATLEADIARARRLNAAWKSLIERSTQLFGVVSKRLAEAMDSSSARDAGAPAAVTARDAKVRVKSSN